MDHSETKNFIAHEPAQLDNPRRLLLKGAALIEERGHYKGSYTDGHGLCFRGALSIAAGVDFISNSPECDEASILFLKYMRDSGRFLPGGWLPWNDAPERTATEVISAMRAAALS